MSGEFLTRWSRLKRESDKPEQRTETAGAADVEAATEGEPVDQIAEAEAAPVPTEAAGAAAELSEEEIAALPPIEGLGPASDIAPFLRAGVPRLLRNAALRRVWEVDPAIRDFVDDAREYAYDWNAPGCVPGLGPLQPCDDVKAMVRRIFDRAGEAEAEPTAESVDSPEPTEIARTADPESAPPDRASRSDDTATDEAPADDAPAGDAEPPREKAPPRPRRHGGATPV